MAIRVDSASFSGTGICVGGSGLGVKGSVIRATTATGAHGEGLLYDDWDSAADDDKEFRAFVTSWPSDGTLFVGEAGDFALMGAADGSYAIGYRLDIDGAAQGTTSETVNVGVLTVQADFTAARTLLAAVQQDFSASRTVLAAVQQDFSAARSIFEAVQADFTSARGVLAAVQQDFSGAREIEAVGQVSADFTAARQILQVVQADFSASRVLEAPLSVQADFTAVRAIAQIIHVDFTSYRLIAPEELIGSELDVIRPPVSDRHITRSAVADRSVVRPAREPNIRRAA